MLQLPIFVILPAATSQSRRSVKLGWVSDFDDASRQFLVLFGESNAPNYAPAASPAAPFLLLQDQQRKSRQVLTRPGQQRFRFQVIASYGCKCAVCEIDHPSLIKAAHICGKRYNGSDDWRNGLPLCATHHEAFDSFLFAIRPEDRSIQCRPSIGASSIGLFKTQLLPLKNEPHADALCWRWAETVRAWT